MHGNYGPNVLSNDADLVIAIGMRFDDRVTGNLATYLTESKVIHIDIDKAEINKNVPADVPMLGDAKTILRKLIPLVEEGAEEFHRTKWIEKFKEADKVEFDKVINKSVNPGEGEIKMTEVIDKLHKLSDGKAVIVTDVGQHQMIAQRYYRFNDTNLNVTSGGLGTMGFGLPAAIGVQIAYPERQVICISGDSSFQMTMQELGTIMDYDIPVKVLILNNSFLGMVRQWQQLFFDRRYSFTELKNPDFIAIAKAYDIEAQKISERDDIEGALKAMLDCKSSYLLEVVVEKEDNVFPMVPTGASVADVLLE